MGQIHVKEAGELILGFLRVTGASLGSSKSLVDQGGEGEPVLPFLTHMNQIGPDRLHAAPRQGPVNLLPRRGAARSGAGDSSPTGAPSRSTPTAADAPAKADVVYVADAFQVTAKVNALLEGGQGVSRSRTGK